MRDKQGNIIPTEEEDLDDKQVVKMKLNSDSYFQTFDHLFQEQLSIHIKKEQDKHENIRLWEKNMFEFAKRRIKEIEALVTKKYNEEKKIEQARVTKLKNSSIQSNIG